MLCGAYGRRNFRGFREKITGVKFMEKVKTVAIYRVEIRQGKVVVTRGKAQWGNFDVHDPLLASKIADIIKDNLTEQLRGGIGWT